jgi:TRAP-type mannitol/chloroaromatic compound transport system substrate-binding protein
MTISRKSFIKGLAAATLVLPVGLKAVLGKGNKKTENGTGLSNKTYTWKMVTTWPPNFPILDEGCKLFAQMVEEMSGGRLKIRVFGGGELVPALEIFDAVRNGAAEIGHGSAYYWAGKSPAASFFATVPFGMNAQQVSSWINAGDGLALWQELYAHFGLIPLPAGNTGVQMGGWFNKEINTISDLRGLKMRIPGLGGAVLEKAGGSPILMAGGELYTGLERGIIDATEWLSPFHDSLMGFDEIAKYYYTPGWHEPGTNLEIILNKAAFETLPTDLQAIIKAAASYSGAWIHDQMEAKNAVAYAELLKKGVEIRTFPPDVISELRKLTKEVISELVNKDPFTNKVYTSYQTFQEKANKYSQIAERAFYDQLQDSFS